MVSVIVPVYNNEKYIERCLESLLNQDYQDYEIIIVNDGSTDSTLDKCKQYNSKRIHIINQENSGPAVARNTGIAACNPSAEYVFFVDSDDTVTPNYISTMLKYASDNVLVVSDINVITEINTIDETIANSSSTNNEVIHIENLFETELFYNYLINGKFNSLCNKCFSLKIIRKHNLTLPKGFPEDARFCLEYIKYIKSISLIPLKTYNYIKLPGSVTSKGYKELFDNYMNIQQELYSISPSRFHHLISEYVYPQYVGNTKKFIKNGDYKTAVQYLKKKLIRKSINEHRSTCIGDAFIKYCIKFHLFKLLLIV